MKINFFNKIQHMNETIQNRNLAITDIISKRITSLRYLLMVLIVFLHANPAFIYTFDKPEYYKITIKLIFYLADAAVPVYLLFSGYLQLIKNDRYSNLLKKRFSSLFLPYIIWITLYCFFYNGVRFICSHISSLSFLFTNKDNINSNWSIVDYLKGYTVYFADRPLKNPFVQQFWFLRDLMLYILMSYIYIYIWLFITVLCS